VAVIDEYHGIYDLPFLCVFVGRSSKSLMGDASSGTGRREQAEKGGGCF